MLTDMTNEAMEAVLRHWNANSREEWVIFRNFAVIDEHVCPQPVIRMVIGGSERDKVLRALIWFDKRETSIDRVYLGAIAIQESAHEYKVHSSTKVKSMYLYDLSEQEDYKRSVKRTVISYSIEG